MIEITPEYLASQGLSETFPQRFWKKVFKDGPIPEQCPELGPCWIWLAHLDHAGYGFIGKGSRVEGLIKAHRASWILHFGPIPEGMRILHRCDLPTCVSPLHLWMGTQGENIRDSVEKGRMLRGETNGRVKLTKEKVIQIRHLYSLGENNKTSLGKRFGVTRECIYAIVNHVNWRHV